VLHRWHDRRIKEEVALGHQIENLKERESNQKGLIARGSLCWGESKMKLIYPGRREGGSSKKKISKVKLRKMKDRGKARQGTRDWKSFLKLAFLAGLIAERKEAPC